ncbi:MAG TPA: hypothetical protein VGP31_15160 [Planosporangium sp.]|nr:hypothetical protein [Planosporangium sp.]
MALRDDLERVLAVARAETVDLEALIADEHERQRVYLAALAAVPAAGEAETIALVLRDPDRVMAESVLMSHIDRQASRLASSGSFAAWAAGLAGLVGQESFPARRIREWRLFKTVMDGGNADAATLADSSNWLQRKIVDEAVSPTVLDTMGEVGRTKRVRNLAKTRAGRLRRESAP